VSKCARRCVCIRERVSARADLNVNHTNDGSTGVRTQPNAHTLCTNMHTPSLKQQARDKLVAGLRRVFCAGREQSGAMLLSIRAPALLLTVLFAPRPPRSF